MQMDKMNKIRMSFVLPNLSRENKQMSTSLKRTEEKVCNAIKLLCHILDNCFLIINGK